MALGQKTGGKNFEKGNQFGKGRPPVSPDLKKLMKLNQNELHRLLNATLDATKEDLMKIQKDESAKAVERAFVSIIIKAIQTGDHTRMEWMISRLLGKIPDVVHVQEQHVDDESKKALEEYVLERKQRNEAKREKPSS